MYPSIRRASSNRSGSSPRIAALSAIGRGNDSNAPRYQRRPSCSSSPTAPRSPTGVLCGAAEIVVEWAERGRPPDRKSRPSSMGPSRAANVGRGRLRSKRARGLRGGARHLAALRLRPRPINRQDELDRAQRSAVVDSHSASRRARYLLATCV